MSAEDFLILNQSSVAEVLVFSVSVNRLFDCSWNTATVQSAIWETEQTVVWQEIEQWDGHWNISGTIYTPYAVVVENSEVTNCYACRTVSNRTCMLFHGS